VNTVCTHSQDPETYLEAGGDARGVAEGQRAEHAVAVVVLREHRGDAVARPHGVLLPLLLRCSFVLQIRFADSFRRRGVGLLTVVVVVVDGC